MALESGSFIDDLVATNPVSATDLVRYGAGHLRLLKDTLKNSFAGSSGVILVAAADASAVANTITLSPTPALTEYTSRMLVVWHQAVTNTGAVTMNISGLGAKSVVDVAGNALTSGDLVANKVYLGVYNGTAVQLMAVTKNYIDQLSFSAELPAQSGKSLLVTDGTNASWAADQTGNSGKFLKTDGSNISWDVAGINGYSAKTGAYTILATDKEKLIDCTSGTFTLSFTACASLGSSWAVYVRNSGTGDITLDPSGSEQIDGLTSFVMYPGESRLVFCDGSALRSAVVQPFTKTFSSSGTFTMPPGYLTIGTRAIGGGAGGGGGRTSHGGGGGGGGACVQAILGSITAGAAVTVTVGAGGNGGAATANGTAGGNTSFGSYATAYGGGLGASASAANAGGGGGGGSASAGGNAAPTTGGAGGNPRTNNLGSSSSGSQDNVGGGGGGSPAASTSGGSAEFGGGGGGMGGDGSSGTTGRVGGCSIWGGGGGGGGSQGTADVGGIGGVTRDYGASTGAAGGTTSGGAGTAGAAGVGGYGGGGGGGGGGNAAGTGGVGGAGGLPGGGGGGGGRGSAAGGAGGAGAAGQCMVWGIA